MTTTVEIYAHCADDKEVKVIISDIKNDTVIETLVLQDKQSAIRYVYDDRNISIQEVAK